MLKEYSKGLDFHAAYFIKADFNAHKTKAHHSRVYLHWQLASTILSGYVSIMVCYIHYLMLLVSKPFQCYVTAYMQCRGEKWNLPLMFAASPYISP